jgi:hypothetical protein
MTLRISLVVIAISQLVLGLAFLLAPGPFETLLNLTPAAPAWADWLIAMLGARFLGYAVGMFVAARDPQRHQAWIATMIGIQAVDWAATMAYVVRGQLTFAQVGPAAVLPVFFVAALLGWGRDWRRHA